MKKAVIISCDSPLNWWRRHRGRICEIVEEENEYGYIKIRLLVNDNTSFEAKQREIIGGIPVKHIRTVS
ncbi:hypothetical protein [Paenibacillus chitinolyticus]|uniref:Uncharacterized protein n=1 Tax=Paenibacillus chitinolyticus TaxID=79263 RepID=A0ABT4FMQ9_9BACL|nr:hypothetical protein [Paenibacillus chitinolyticus]MCY9592340.1 hypothetical protein [Paenibacillus chitinolyticus]MCY9599802.1 hypothetical protein [Paenibacillus chitinolyticus]